MCERCTDEWYAQRHAVLPMRILDGCSGIGGITRGLSASGKHEVWGVDNNPRLRDDYLRSGGSEFICADILEVLSDTSFMSQFGFTHCSFPCQAYSRMVHCRPGLAAQYPRLIAPGRELLGAWGRPYAIENVSGARPEMIDPVTLCMWGHFGRETYRHRLIEAGGGFRLTVPAPPAPSRQDHQADTGIRLNRECGRPHPVPTAKAGHWKPGYFVSVAGHERKEQVRRVMEIHWAREREDVAEAVPPYVGAWLAQQLELMA